MSANVLNEHDANQGAQSKGEFLGMGGNSSWFVLGAAATSLFIIYFLWGVCGFSLLACAAAGAGLCALALLYVFTLRNNKPKHYDTDFFESALIESGLLSLRFGPREKRPKNPFRDDRTLDADQNRDRAAARQIAGTSGASKGSRASSGASKLAEGANAVAAVQKQKKAEDDEPKVSLVAYERLKADLAEAEDQLAEVLSEREED